MKVFVVFLLLFSMFVSPGDIVSGSLFGERVLQQGMQGSDVASLQQTLVDIGYTLGVDGVFGEKTRLVVQQVQMDHNVTPDGIVGSQTMEIISSLGDKVVSHVVRQGDTLYDIARLFGTSIRSIMELNNLPSSVIRPGQLLKVIANSTAAEYVVSTGENLSTIAQKFGISSNEIAQVNKIQNPDRLMPGQRLVIPVMVQSALASRASAAIQQFSWPLQGRISSPYGWRIHPITRNRDFHGGIDIAVPKGTLIRAAASGRVVTASWMGAYGNGVVIDHGNGYSTWYGHASELLVRAGEHVLSGQYIARVGSTGLATGPHLDFRIKINDKTVNPIDYLP